MKVTAGLRPSLPTFKAVRICRADLLTKSVYAEIPGQGGKVLGICDVGWKPEAGSTLCRLPASGERPNSNRQESASARNGGFRGSQALPDGDIEKIYNH